VAKYAAAPRPVAIPARTTAAMSPLHPPACARPAEAGPGAASPGRPGTAGVVQPVAAA
jgi:hypothetical protein